ncbi:MAG: response regulator transcription factor [Spirochaetes bacterium]|nr:response regulator transcription factor [Spirochaetota bacterium]
MPSGNKYKIVIVDDHPVVRQGLKLIIEDEDDLIVCGETGSANDGIKMIGDIKPDLALVDLRLEGSASGLDLVKSIRQRFPAVLSLVISMHDDLLYAERAIAAGARGYVMKSEAESNIISAIRDVLAGKLYLRKEASLNIVSKVLHKSNESINSSIDNLSDREFEILQLLGNGFGTQKIAKKLNLSVNTIETHRRNIKKKLDLKDSDELMQFAIRWYIDSQK